jgi:hypothetical protein
MLPQFKNFRELREVTIGGGQWMFTSLGHDLADGLSHMNRGAISQMVDVLLVVVKWLNSMCIKTNFVNVHFLNCD